MEFSKVQLATLLNNHIEGKPDGLNEVLKMISESLMKSERKIHLDHDQANKANGYRLGKVYGHGKLLELRIPRDRNGHFYPKLLAILRHQQAETDRLVSALYGQGLTQSQLGQVFDDLYGRHYSSSTIGRMIDWMRKDVRDWLDRDLLAYYPIIYVDALHVKVRRSSVANEAFYVVLAVLPDATREVIAIEHMPTESGTGWQVIFQRLRERGVEKVGLVVADVIAGLEKAATKILGSMPVQQCVVHLKRGLAAHVRPKLRGALFEDLAHVFPIGDKNISSEMGWQRWNEFCQNWGKTYDKIARMANNEDYRNCFTYLDFDYRIQSMIYTTNWIERLNRDFRRVLKMRGAMPDEESVMVLMGKVAMDKKAYQRKVPKLDYDKRLFGPNSPFGEDPPQKVKKDC